jgi:hypothetical protein
MPARDPIRTGAGTCPARTTSYNETDMHLLPVGNEGTGDIVGEGKVSSVVRV